VSSPFTDTLAIMGKVTLYFELQNVLISWFGAGLLAAKIIAGMPKITKPRSLYFS